MDITEMVSGDGTETWSQVGLVHKLSCKGTVILGLE